MYNVSKRKLFVVFNRAIAKARQSPDAPKLIQRLHLALGIIQHHDYYQQEKTLYHPTVRDCGCKDWEYYYARKRQYRGYCKHVMAEILINRMNDVHYQQLDFFSMNGEQSVQL